MENIIIVAHRGEHNPGLIELMKVLFPESEIQTAIHKEESDMADENNASWGDRHDWRGKGRP